MGTGSKPLVAVALAAALAALAVGACSGGAPGSSTPATDGSASPSPAVSPSASPGTVLLYFGRADLDPCTDLAPVERSVPAATPEDALRALLAGPTAEEVAAGYQSWFSATTADALAGVSVRDGIVGVSFHDLRTLIPNASSSCGSGALLGSLDATLGQFPEISGARYSIEGDEAAFYEWLQRDVPPR